MTSRKNSSQYTSQTHFNLPPKITEASSGEIERADKDESNYNEAPPTQDRKLINTESIPSGGYQGTIGTLTSSLSKNLSGTPISTEKQSDPKTSDSSAARTTPLNKLT